MKRLTISVVLMLAAGGAQAAPFSAVPDEPGAVWVIDGASGALERCATRADSVGAKVVDVFGGSGDVRPQSARAGRAVCRQVRAGAQDDPRARRIDAILRARTGTLADLYGGRPAPVYVVWPRGTGAW